MPIADAHTLLAGLRARGVSVTLVNNRVRVVPWAAMTFEEQVALRERRQELKALLRGGPVPPKQAARAAAPAPPPPAPRVPVADYARYGLVEIEVPVYPRPYGGGRTRRIVTHAHGDDFAQDILSGKVSLAEAEEIERDARQTLRAWLDLGLVR